MPIPDETVRRILRSWPVGVLSTYGAGCIHSVPVVFVTVGADIYSPIDGKPKSGRVLQRITDLSRDDRFTLLLQHYEADWRALWWLRLRGRGHVTGVPELDGSLLDKIVTGLRVKYPQYEQTEVLRPPGQVLHLRMTEATAWAAAGDDWLERTFAEAARPE